MGKPAEPFGTLDGLMDELRAIDGLVVKGKTQSAFYFKSKPFLHFHRTERGIHADVRFGADWEEVPAETPFERRALVARVRAHAGGRA